MNVKGGIQNKRPEIECTRSDEEERKNGREEIAGTVRRGLRLVQI